jgi:hypothetical protein
MLFKVLLVLRKSNIVASYHVYECENPLKLFLVEMGTNK